MSRRRERSLQRERAFRARERDCTPRPVIRQLLEATLDELARQGDRWLPRDRPLHMIEPWAGAGPWASEARVALTRRRIDSHITAVEIESAERRHLRRWTDVEIIADWRAAVEGFGYDLVAANPRFSEITPDFRGHAPHRWPPERSAVPTLLRSAPAVLLLHRTDVLARGEGGQWIAEHHPPAHKWEIAGSIAFRGSGVNPETDERWGSDQRSYAGFLWLRGHTGSWRTSVLPRLSAAERSWTVRPGTESPELAREFGLIEAPRRKEAT